MAKRRKHALWFEQPFEELRRAEEIFHKTMGRLWEEPFRFEFRFPEIRFPKEFTKTIPIDIAETERELVVRADLPGFSKDEIRLKVTPNTLDISAEKKKQEIEKGKNFYRQERSYGAARRMITLPEEVKPEDAKAKFEHGVLEIILPKVQLKKKEKEIKVE